MRVAQTKNRQRLGYRRIVQLLVYLIIVPTVLLLWIGIVQMLQWEHRFNVIIGILLVSVVAVMVTGVTLVIVFVRREANLSQLQADFVSKVSHELRTPLTAIRLFAETMERAKGDVATTEKCLTALNAETERLTMRIERLLDWGRMEAGRRQYELTDVSLKDVVDDSVAAFSPFRTGAATLVCEVQPDLPLVLGDRHALSDAVLNLLSNAHKYGGTPAVIELRAFAGVGVVSVEVKDNGAGIPRPEHRRIFDKFYRIDDRLSRNREGSGLGLAIVKHIIRAHRGSIVVDSREGSGSTFRLSFPARRRINLAKPTEVTSP